MSETTAFTSSSSSSVPMVVITVVGIFAAFALLASYYAFVTKCQLLRPWLSPWRGGVGHGDPSSSPSSTPTLAEERQRRGLGLPLIRMLPVVKYTAADGRRASVSSECAVCLCEFAEKERVRLLPGCSHAFHIDCIDTWLQGSARCPFCRRSVTLPSLPLPMMPPPPMERPRDVERLAASGNGDESSIVIEVRGEHESWAVGHAGGDDRRKVQRKKKAVGDEAVETRTRKVSEELAVEPMRRSLSMDSNLYVSSVVRGYLLDRAELGKSVST